MERDAAKLKRLLRVQTAKALQSKAGLNLATAQRVALDDKLNSIDALCRSDPTFEFVYGEQVYSYRKTLNEQRQSAQQAETQARVERISNERKADKVEHMHREADRMEERAQLEKDLMETIQRMIPDGK